MRKIILLCLVAIFSMTVKAQIPVTDVANVTQSIVNSIQQIVHTSTTASNMINNFKETVKLYEQGKRYYDALKSVSDLVKDARKVQKTILLIGEISDIFINNYQKMLSDKNFTPKELGAISWGYSKILQEATDLLVELKTIIHVSNLSLTDRDRMEVIERVYKDVRYYRDLVNYYTRKNIGVSLLRAREKRERDRVLSLYGMNERYW